MLLPYSILPLQRNFLGDAMKEHSKALQAKVRNNDNDTTAV